MVRRSDEDKAEIEQIAQDLWQGDLLATPLIPVLESPHSTFVDGVDELEPVDEHGLWTVAPQQINTGWGAIVTQTCDLVRHPDKVPYLQLMPVVELDEVTWKTAHYGSGGDYFALPAIDAAGLVFPAIDSQLSFPVSKAALGHADIARAAAPLDPAARVLLSSWLMRRVGRYAFPNELEHHVLSHLRTKTAKSMGKNSMAGRFADALLGVWSSTEWAATVSLIFIVDPNRLASQQTIDAEKAMSELVAPIRKRLADDGVKVQILPTTRTLDKVSAQQLFIEHRQVDMDALPTDEFTAKASLEALAALGTDTAHD
jgi:hypothetical protein